jgi:hypothetical protein
MRWKNLAKTIPTLHNAARFRASPHISTKAMSITPFLQEEMALHIPGAFVNYDTIM